MKIVLILAAMISIIGLQANARTLTGDDLMIYKKAVYAADVSKLTCKVTNNIEGSAVNFHVYEILLFVYDAETLVISDGSQPLLEFNGGLYSGSDKFNSVSIETSKDLKKIKSVRFQTKDAIEKNIGDLLNPKIIKVYEIIFEQTCS